MTHPTAQYPNETYLSGLRSADAPTFETIYKEFRKPVSRAVEAAGGSHSDGNTFFRVALIQASSLVHEMKLAETPIFYFLKNLAVAHFRDWATEKNVELPELPPVPEEEAVHAGELPDAEARKLFRNNIKVRRQFSRLDADCQKVVQELANDASLGISDPRLDTERNDACVEKYRSSLDPSSNSWGGTLPAPVAQALSDKHFQKAWSTAEALENRVSMGQSTSAQPESKTARNALIVLVLLVLGYGLWSYFTTSKSPGKVYNENFNPPTSIMADREARLAKDTLPPESNEVCEQLFAQADEAYKRQDYREAASVLFDMTRDDLESCNSDALFYLAIIGLHLEEPEITIDCLAKIPDLDRFGEDLYWYQALAFVKIAAQNPMKRDIARRAVERARSNTELPERRTQAEKMLEQLAK